MPIPCPVARTRGTGSPGRAARARGWWNDALWASWQTSFRRTRSPGRAARARGWWSDALCASWQTSFRRTRSPGRAARARGWWSDALCASLHHFRDDKEMVLAGRGVLHDVVGNPAVGHLVGTLFHGHRGHRRHRVDAIHLDLGQLLDKGQNGIELAAEVLDLFVGDRNARQMRDAADGRGIDGHGTSQAITKMGFGTDRLAAL